MRLLMLVCMFFNFSVFAEKDFWILTNPEPPFVELDDKSQLSGYPVDLVKGILQEANIQQSILTAPWTRVEKEARTKANVLVFALARTPEREKEYYWITPITANVFGLYAKKSKQIKINRLKDVSKFGRVGVLRDDARHELLANYVPSHISPFENWQQTMSALIDDKVSTIFFSDAGVEIFCVRLKTDCNQIERIYTYQLTQSYLALSKPGTRPELVEKLTEAASRFKNKQEYADLSAKWITHYKNTLVIPMHLSNGVLNLWKHNATIGNRHD
jgi:polar amino acid transport system substrate-binding protein